MRLGLIAAAAIACGGEIWVDRVEPAEGLALGGYRVEVIGRGFGDDLRVSFGDAPSPAVEVLGRGRATAELPRGIAGRVPVRVSSDEADDELPDGFRYLPMELSFLDPGPGWTPPAGPLLDGWSGDLDGDGLDDVLVLSQDFVLSWWRNTGSGSLIDGGPLVEDPVMAAAIADLDGDGRLDVAICPRDATSPRLLFGDPGGRPVGVPGAIPFLPGRCDAIALGPGGEIGWLRREGAGSVVELLDPDGAGGWRRRGPVSEGACPVSAGLSCEVAPRTDGGFSATIQAETRGDLRVPIALGRLPTAFEVRVLHADQPLAALIVDDDGQRFTAPIDPGAGLRVVRDPAAWTSDGSGEIALPIRGAGLVIDGGEGRVVVADLLLHLPGGARVLVTEFADHLPPVVLSRRHHRLALADLDADGALDLLVGDSTVGGDVTGYLDRGDGFGPIAPSRLDPLQCGIRDLAAAPLVGQGGPDLVIACRDGQDRLLVNDGTGRFFDDTARLLPLSRGDSARLTLADLDLDGLPELLIAKRDAVDRLYGSYRERWLDRTGRLGLNVADTRRLLALDVDGDGDLDLIGLGGDGGWLRIAVTDGPRRDGEW